MEEDRIMNIPVGFPSILFPEGNEYCKARWELGKRLFMTQFCQSKIQ